MGYSVSLLCLVLIGTAVSQSPTATPETGGVSSSPKEEKATSVKSFSPSDGNSTDVDTSEEGDLSDLEGEESRPTFKFSEADAPNARQWSKPPEFVPEGNEGDASDEDAEAAMLVQELTSLLKNGMSLMSNGTDDSDTKKVEQNDGGKEEGEDGENPDVDNEEETADLKTDGSQIKRQDKPNFSQNKQTSLDFDDDQSSKKSEIPAPPSDAYVTLSDQPYESISENDNSPLLQLTQGGYTSPYLFNSESPRVRAQSASQQSETLKNPTDHVNDEDQFRQPQVSPQISYADPFQSQFGLGSALGLQHPFIPPDSFVNSNGMVHQPVQNGFFNVPPAGFTDFTGTNFQTPFSPSNDGGFQVLTRNPSGVSLYQTPSEHVVHNPGFVVQNPQFPQNQFAAPDPTQPPSALYQSPGFLNYPGSENTNISPRPDYSPFFRHPAPNNLQFQVNSNPFAPPRSTAGILYNPMVQFQPNFPNRPQYSLQYPPQNQQDLAQSTAVAETKPTESDKTAEGEATKTEEQANASTNKEDSSDVPFGARIQRQNTAESQSNNPYRTDFYMRYPVKEAGYATEESLPIQNTTTKTETKNDAPPTRPVYSFFQVPSQLGDPYRNALNSAQRGFTADSIVGSNENSNRTKQAQAEQLPTRVPFPSSQPAMAHPMSGYPDARNRNPPLMRPPSFFHAVDGAATDPFDQLAMFPDQFGSPMQTGSQPQEAPVPSCALGKSNASVCFEDTEYPKREVLFALNSDPYLMDRFSLPEQQLDAMSLVEQNRLEHPESPSNYICSSKIRYGFPLRAKDVDGQWKVIVNVEKNAGQGRFAQPVRLEMCKAAGDPCNFTEVKTACVQKYNFHRLLSWSPEKGVHNDVFKLPVACSCQLIDTQAS